jgi:hypothetical protein
VRDLQEISGIGSSGRSSPGSGGRRWCSAGMHEEEGAAGGRRWRSRCGKRWGSSGSREEGRRGVGTGDEWSSASGERAARRQHGRGKEKRGGKGGGPGRGGPCVAGGAMGPGPDRRASPGNGPSAALAGDVRRALACRSDRAGREASNEWAAAQCRAVVLLIGGVGLSAGAVESAGARGPAREESGVAEPR